MSVVGYQNIAINPGFNMIDFNFQPLHGSEDISIQDFVQNTAVGGDVIPEPSSALLLLLGMAGIALRHKQA